jgi:hypothetical protein
MPTLIGKEVGPTGYGLMRKLHALIDSYLHPELLNTTYRHDLESHATF